MINKTNQTTIKHGDRVQAPMGIRGSVIAVDGPHAIVVVVRFDNGVVARVFASEMVVLDV